MKRLNANTNAPFKLGDVRDDGRIFVGYETNKKPKLDGFFSERWLTPERFALWDIKRSARAKLWAQSKDNRLRQIARHAQGSANKRKQCCEISVADVIAQFDKQDGLCAYTGWPMDFATRSEMLVSIERIDNAIGYTPDNIVLVCWCVNKARSGMTQQRFFEMCSAVTNGSLSHYKKV